MPVWTRDPVGVYEKDAPLHEEAACDGNAEVGLTVTDTANEFPTQVTPEYTVVGVTLYVAVTAPVGSSIGQCTRQINLSCGTRKLHRTGISCSFAGVAHAYVVTDRIVLVEVGVYEKATSPQVDVPCAGMTGVAIVILTVFEFADPGNC